MKVVACKKKKLPFQSQLRRRRPLQNLQLHRLLIHLLIEFRSFSIWASFPVKFKQTPSYGRGVFHKICDLYLHYCYAYMIKIPKSGIVVQKLPSNVLKRHNRYGQFEDSMYLTAEYRTLVCIKIVLM